MSKIQLTLQSHGIPKYERLGWELLNHSNLYEIFREIRSNIRK